MTLFTKCERCEGHGSLKCAACVCVSCGGRGNSRCMGNLNAGSRRAARTSDELADQIRSQCKAGRVGCGECSATGETQCQSCSGFGRTLHGWWLIKWSTSCSTCGGAKHRRCARCSGKASMPCTMCAATGVIACADCGGTGATATCDLCAGVRVVRCAVCRGAGRLETKWSRQLRSHPVEQLRFEYEKRQRHILALQTENARLSRERQDLYDLEDEWLAADDPGWSSPSASISIVNAKMLTNETQISSAEEEMTEIQQVLDAK